MFAKHTVCEPISTSRRSPGAGASSTAHNLTHSANATSRSRHVRCKMGKFAQMATAQSKQRPAPHRRPAQTPPPPETVDPRWLLKAVGAVFALGLLCAYLTVCGLFYNQQWQFVLNPSRVVPKTPSSVGLSFQPVRFGVDSAGKPQLAAWWIPTGQLNDQPNSQFNNPTVLMLHGGDGSMSDALPAARALHDAQLNVLLFDYRGYGQSSGAHPTASAMRRDTADALQYLTSTRGIGPRSIVIYGAGLGASLAVSLCKEHPEIPAIILQSADGDTTSRVARDPRARVVPVWLLFHEQFPLADPLRSLPTPKLFLSFTGGSAPVDATRAADPKTTAELPPGTAGPEITGVIRRFLDTYVQHPPAILRPNS